MCVSFIPPDGKRWDSKLNLTIDSAVLEVLA